jgi:hypothetical protein
VYLSENLSALVLKNKSNSPTPDSHSQYLDNNKGLSLKDKALLFQKLSELSALVFIKKWIKFPLLSSHNPFLLAQEQVLWYRFSRFSRPSRREQNLERYNLKDADSG